MVEQSATDRDNHDKQHAEHADTDEDRHKESCDEIERCQPKCVANHEHVTRNLTRGYVSKLTAIGEATSPGFGKKGVSDQLKGQTPNA